MIDNVVKTIFKNRAVQWLAVSLLLFCELPGVRHVIGYWRNIMLAIDHGWNAVAFGDPRETASSTLGKLKQSGQGCVLCGLLCGFLSIVFLEPNHCLNSINTKLGMGTDDDHGVLKAGKRSAYANLMVVMIVIGFFCLPDIASISHRLLALMGWAS